MSLRLAAFLAEATLSPEGDVRVTGLRRLAGGASRELWSLDAEIAVGAGSPERLALVLRRDPPGRVGEGDLPLEFRLLEAAAAAGVPVPGPRFCDEGTERLGAPFYLMDRVAGEAIPRRLLRDEAYAKAREGLLAELARSLARIHSIDPDAPRLAGLSGEAASARAEVERLGEGLRRLAVEPHPVLELAERWLLERAPEPRRRALVHGDFRLGNAMVGPEGLRAVLDWELAHAGDPVEDLGWLCVRAWRFGRDELPAAGLGTREELVRAYEEAGGDAVDPEALRFWEACGNLKLALVFVTQARAFLDGVPSIELASLGRRIAEAEDELLRFLEDDAA